MRKDRSHYTRTCGKKSTQAKLARNSHGRRRITKYGRILLKWRYEISLEVTDPKLGLYEHNNDHPGNTKVQNLWSHADD